MIRFADILGAQSQDRRSSLRGCSGSTKGARPEASLKLKEVAQFPAEAYSSAEVRHGPWQLGETDCALIGWKLDAISFESQNAVVDAYRALGRSVLDLQHIGPQPADGLGGLTAPLVPLPAFYRALVNAATIVAQGLRVANYINTTK